MTVDDHSASDTVSDYDEDGLAEKYIEMKDINPYFAGDRRVLRKLLKDAEERRKEQELPPTKDLCDLACGNGYYSRLFKRDALERGEGLNITGIDLSHDMIKDAQAQEEKDKLGLNFYQGDVNNDETVDKAGGPFDVCTASYLINYFTKEEDLVSVLTGVRKLLRPGGHFIGTTVNPDFNLDEPEEFLDRFGCWFVPPKDNKRPEEGGIVRVYLSMCNEAKDKLHLDVAYWSKEAYEAAFEKAGIPIVKWQLKSKDPNDPVDGASKEGEDIFWSKNTSIAFMAQRVGE